MALFVVVVGVMGISALGNVKKAANAIFFEEVPTADAAMEMHILLIHARDLMAEYLLENDVSKLPEMEVEFEESMREFDTWADAIVNGGTVGDTKVATNDNKRLHKLVEEAQTQHEAFEKEAREMMEHHKKALEIQKMTLNAEAEEALEHMGKKDHIFEPFYTTKEAGTGLGLAIAQKTVFDLNGTIEVESNEGEGTTFRVGLPVIQRATKKGWARVVRG